jgi:hypothetical protein
MCFNKIQIKVWYKVDDSYFLSFPLCLINYVEVFISFNVSQFQKISLNGESVHLKNNAVNTDYTPSRFEPATL